MPGAYFKGANLTGANLSESDLTSADFTNATLYNTCLCYSTLTACNFQYTSFGATDMTGATIKHSRFAGQSCFTLNFSQAYDMQGCAYIHSDGDTSKMSNPPIVINGTDTHPIIIMDDSIKNAQTIIKQNNIHQIAQRATAKLARTKNR